MVNEAIAAALTAATILASSTLVDRTAGEPTLKPGALRSAAAPKAVPVRTMIGQRLVVGLAGTVPNHDLLRAIGRGEVGGIILTRPNVPDLATTRRLTRRLQAAARAGGRPRLVIAIDQEGGRVKRARWAPPFRPPPVLGRLGNAAARAEGLRTGRALRAAGIGVDLAPVVDVPASWSSHIAREGRAFGFSSFRVAERAGAFASGLRAAGVQPVLKHFPGLGLARTNTDYAPQRLTPTKARREADLRPYRRAFRAGSARAVMLSWATYPAYDAAHLAGRSRAVAGTLLRRTLGFGGVAFTDSLAAKAVQRVTRPERMAVAAARADVDFLLWGGTGPSWKAAHRLLRAAARAGALKRPQLEAAHRRIIAFKKTLPR